MGLLSVKSLPQESVQTVDNGIIHQVASLLKAMDPLALYLNPNDIYLGLLHICWTNEASGTCPRGSTVC